MDLTGKVYGRLTVLGRSHYRTQPNGARVLYWKCKCECGAEVSVNGAGLRGGTTQSCGCLQKERVSAKLTKKIAPNTKFGRLTVLKRASNIQPTERMPGGRVAYLCKCECGVELVVRGDALRNGTTKSCGCYQRDRVVERVAKPLDSGSVFGYLTVIERDLTRTKFGYHYLCECRCGNKCSVSSASLRSGETKSCGCYNKQRTRETHLKEIAEGKRFGRLVVKSRVENINKIASRPSGTTAYLCMCECGQRVVVPGGALRTGHTKSCGCYMREKVSETHSGPNHWNWKDGITLLNHSVRNTVEMTQWKLEVLARDNYTCQISGQLRGELEVHHKKPVSQIFCENNITTLAEARECEELWDINNGITLAKSLHSNTSANKDAFHRVYSNHTCLSDFEAWFVEMKGKSTNA